MDKKNYDELMESYLKMKEVAEKSQKTNEEILKLNSNLLEQLKNLENETIERCELSLIHIFHQRIETLEFMIKKEKKWSQQDKIEMNGAIKVYLNLIRQIENHELSYKEKKRILN